MIVSFVQQDASLYLGYVLVIEAAFMLPAAAISLFSGETRALYAFLITVAVLTAVGFFLIWKRPEKTVLYTKEGLQIAAVSWLAMSFFGALPSS